jgi:signal transduction histidine kinase
VIECAPTQLGALLADCVRARETIAREHSIALTVSTVAIPQVFCDTSRTREVVDNLLDNALKFTPDGGFIQVAATRDGERVRVTVEDDGPGIRAENLERVFEQFFQESRGNKPARNGLGLGLYICRDLIERQGGEIWAESKPAEWTRFIFTLPVATTGE